MIFVHVFELESCSVEIRSFPPYYRNCIENVILSCYEEIFLFQAAPYTFSQLSLDQNSIATVSVVETSDSRTGFGHLESEIE